MEWLIVLLLKYKYLIMFLLMFIEGPIVSFICAFLAAQGFFSFGIVYLFSILGDLSGDILWYGLGRFARIFGAKKFLDMQKRGEMIEKKRLTRKTRISIRVARKVHNVERQAMFQYINKQMGSRFFWTLFLVKITPPLAIPGHLLFGFFKIPFPKFLIGTSVLIIVFESIFLNLGYFSSISINIFKFRLDTVGFVITATVIGGFALRISFLLIKKLKLFSKRT